MPNDFSWTPDSTPVPGEAGAEAIVIEDTVTPDDPSGQFLTTMQPGIFTNYEIHNHYEHDLHTYMMGITSPGGFQGNAVAFVQLAAPTVLLVSDWTAAKWNTMPEYPIIDLDGWVVLARWHKTVSVTFPADGVTPLYRLEGTYVYGCLNPPDDLAAVVVFPRPAWASDDNVERNLSAGTEPQENMIDKQGGGNGQINKRGG